MRVIAFDIGTKRIGVAISDPLQLIASPLTVYERGDDASEDAAGLAQLARENEAGRIVVGMPVSLRGKMELAAQHVEEFIELLGEQTDIEIVTWDERMTTVIAERAMIGADVSRSRRREKIDQVAAAVLLRGYLGAQQNAAGRDDLPDE